MIRLCSIVALVALVALTACGKAEVSSKKPSTKDNAIDCDAGDAAFVRQATLTIVGRRPLSENEVNVAVQAIHAVDAAEGNGAGRRAFALSLTHSPEYADRWEQHVMDALFVSRTGVQSLGGCYDVRDRNDDDGNLARFVRDTGAQDGTDTNGAFTYRDLLRSSLALDDLSPIYRAQMFAMMTTPNTCPNLDPVQQELATRDEVGSAFDAAYLDRDPVCLQCHNSQFSVTDRPDPKEDRHWPLPGSLEAAVFGSSSDVDAKVADGVFRTQDFVGGGNGGGGGPPPVFDYAQGYCYDQNSGNITPATCDATGTAQCGDANLQLFCFGDENPICDANGKPTCANAAFCIDNNNDVDTALSCVNGAVVCANTKLTPICPDYFEVGDQPTCNADGSVSTCPNPGAPGAMNAGEGEGEGEGAPANNNSNNNNGFTPWGADPACGVFTPDVPDDPAGVDAHLASVRGTRATVIGLEAALHRGVDSIADKGFIVRADNSVDGPDEALAYLVAMHVVDGVWREVIGSQLTIATHFPRNKASRDMLKSLTDDFVDSHSSLRTILVDVVTSPYFNLRAPDEKCGEAYSLPQVFDPWVRTEPDPAMQNNSPADGVHVLSGRTMLRAAYAALAWPHPDNESFPDGDAHFDQSCLAFPDCPSLNNECDSNQHCCAELNDLGCSSSSGALSEIDLQRGLGIFHGYSEKGFHGIDFQVRLTWENRFGVCAKPTGVDRDYIDQLVGDAKAHKATLGDAMAALKERLVGEPGFDDDERAALSTLAGNLAQPVSSADAETKLRTLCGVLLSTPQFQLAGLSPAGGQPSPLSPTLGTECASLARRGLDDFGVECGDRGVLSVKRTFAAPHKQ
jgi:hypothetical protein